MNNCESGVPDAPADYSRYDLNGDGFTGGTSYVTRFDLDVDQPQDFSTVSIAAGAQTLQLDENFVVDLDVLCYYARTSLYTGPHKRPRHFDAHCTVRAHR